MSEWRAVAREDIALSDDGETVDVYIGHYDFGNQYIEIPVKFLRELLNIEGDE